MLDALVDFKREIAHQQQAALLDQRHDRRGRIGAIGGDQQIDLVNIEQLGIDAGGSGRVGLVVIHDQLDLAANDAALGVYIITPHLQAQQCGFATRAQPAGLGNRQSDLDRRTLRPDGGWHCRRSRDGAGCRHKLAARDVLGRNVFHRAVSCGFDFNSDFKFKLDFYCQRVKIIRFATTGVCRTAARACRQPAFAYRCKPPYSWLPYFLLPSLIHQAGNCVQSAWFMPFSAAMSNDLSVASVSGRRN